MPPLLTGSIEQGTCGSEKLRGQIAKVTMIYAFLCYYSINHRTCTTDKPLKEALR